MSLTITKRFGEYPFAHRQPDHKGHCRLLHGHNWSFEITFRAWELDPYGFIIDFAEFKTLRKVLEDKFDHTLVIEETDPLLEVISDLEVKLDLVKVTTVNHASCEGIAQYIFELVVSWLEQEKHSPRVIVDKVVVFEDLKNSATYARGLN